MYLSGRYDEHDHDGSDEDIRREMAGCSYGCAEDGGSCTFKLTHGHFDHVSGIKSIKENFPHVPVLIHEKDREFIGKDSQKIQKLSLLPMGFDEFLPTVSDLPEPDFLIEDGKLLSDYVDCH